MQETIHQGSISIARGRVHGQADWLVDHNQVLVLEQHIELHRLRLEVGEGFWRWHPELHLISLA